MAPQQAEQCERLHPRDRVATLGALAGIAAAGSPVEALVFPRLSHALAIGAISPPLRSTAPIFKKTVACIRQHENAA